MKKLRVNITVDKDLLERAKIKLGLFGGKLSTLFNVFLADFVESIDNKLSDSRFGIEKKLKELEKKLNRLEKRRK